MMGDLSAKTQAADPAATRGKILDLEAAMLKEPQVEIKTTHHFAPGIYMREIFIPKGVTLVGAIHKTEHLNVLSRGEIAVWTEDGMKRIRASAVIPSGPGIKRVGHAIEDSVWITVCQNPDDSRDVEILEERLTAKTFGELLEFMDQKAITQEVD